MKYFTVPSLALLVTLVIFFSSATVPVVQAGEVTISQFVEMLITVGVISPEKAVAARTAAVSLSATAKTSTTTVVSTVVPPSFLKVIEPKATETWSSDGRSMQEIKWGSISVPSIKIALTASSTKATKTASSTEATNCEIVPNNIISKDGDNSLTVITPVICYNKNGTQTNLKDGTYGIKIYGTDLKGKEIKADGVSIKIISPTLAVTYPNGGETLLSKGTYIPRYTLTNATKKSLKFSLVDSLSNIIPLVLKETKSSTSTLVTSSFKVDSSIEAGPYKFKLEVTTANGTKLEDISNNFFWISDTL